MARRDMAAEGITPEQLAQSLFRNREAHEIALSRVQPTRGEGKATPLESTAAKPAHGETENPEKVA